MVEINGPGADEPINRPQADPAPPTDDPGHQPTQRPDSPVMDRLMGRPAAGASKNTSFQSPASSASEQTGGQSTAGSPPERGASLGVYERLTGEALLADAFKMDEPDSATPRNQSDSLDRLLGHFGFQPAEIREIAEMGPGSLEGVAAIWPDIARREEIAALSHSLVLHVAKHEGMIGLIQLRHLAWERSGAMLAQKIVQIGPATLEAMNWNRSQPPGE